MSIQVELYWDTWTEVYAECVWVFPVLDLKDLDHVAWVGGFSYSAQHVTK